MKRISILFLSLTLIALVFISGCVGDSLKFKECKLQESKIKEGQMTSLWIEVENKGKEQKNVSLEFIYPEYVTVERDGKLIKYYNITIEPNGATSGRKEFKIRGKYIQGQPSSPWKILIQMYADGKMVKKCEQTITILPPA